MDKTSYMKQEAMKYSYNRCSKFRMGETDCIPDINKLRGEMGDMETSSQSWTGRKINRDRIKKKARYCVIW